MFKSFSQLIHMIIVVVTQIYYNFSYDSIIVTVVLWSMLLLLILLNWTKAMWWWCVCSLLHMECYATAYRMLCHTHTHVCTVAHKHTHTDRKILYLYNEAMFSSKWQRNIKVTKINHSTLTNHIIKLGHVYMFVVAFLIMSQISPEHLSTVQ